MHKIHSAALPRIIGHRGACGRAPENTLASIALAAELGAHAVAFDVALTRDGHAVLLHDETLARTTDGDGALATCDFADVRRYDAGSWFAPAFAGERVPALAEALDLVQAKGLRLNMELQPSPGREVETARAVAGVVRTVWTQDEPIVVSSFSAAALDAYRVELPDAVLGLIVEEVPHDWRARLAAHHCVGLHCHHSAVTAELVAQVHAAGAWLNAYTVNDEVHAQGLLELGVDALFTDQPDVLLAYAFRS